MNRKTIEQAAKEFAEREYETNSIDRDYLHKGFYHGALYVLDRLCLLSSTHAVGKELAEYVEENSKQPCHKNE